MVDYCSNSFLPGKDITTPTVLRVKRLPQWELLVITPKVILFISQTDLVKYLQMPVNGSNLKKLPLFTPKFHPRVCWVILIIPQLQCTTIENARIYTINTIDIIDCNKQYKDNQYDQSDKFTV